MKKIILLTVFFFAAPTLLLFSLAYLSFLSYKANPSFLFSSQTKAVSYAALPTAENIFDTQINEKDARVENVRQFLSQYSSPLEPFSQNIIDAADKYNLDFRLLPAIAMQESNLCKKAPAGSHNCWGFGIYGKTVTSFDSYKEAIDTVTKTLALEYKNKGLGTPLEIMSKYTPSNNGAWAASVNHFMNVLQ